MGRRPDYEPPRKIFLCKHCKVRVISKTNLKAIWTQEHKRGCPRRNK